MRIGGGRSWCVVRVEGGRGKNGLLILIGMELLSFPQVWVGLGIQLSVAEHRLEFGVVEWAMDGGVDVFLGWRRGQSGQRGSVRGSMGWGGRRIGWIRGVG